MKKVLAFLLTLFCVLWVTGCQPPDAGNDKNPGDTASTKPVEEPQADSSEEGGKTGNALTAAEDDTSKARRDDARKSLGMR